MVTMVLIGSGALMLTMFLMRRTASGSRRDRGDGIRWRGIDWSQANKENADEADEDHFKKSQD
ncbi:MAG TPA: hypothetical protein VH054_13105 [Polyangiaceae bacterium]|jgi:hypothetical protein|nr:hypothetical protein [Polyangiaceae bacterium]